MIAVQAHAFYPLYVYLFVCSSSIADNEQLARSGTNCLENLAIAVGRQLFPETWDKVCQCARNIFVAALPEQLLIWQPDESFLTRSYSTLSVAASTRSSLVSEVSLLSTVCNGHTCSVFACQQSHALSRYRRNSSRRRGKREKGVGGEETPNAPTATPPPPPTPSPPPPPPCDDPEKAVTDNADATVAPTLKEPGSHGLCPGSRHSGSWNGTRMVWNRDSHQYRITRMSNLLLLVKQNLPPVE